MPIPARAMPTSAKAPGSGTVVNAKLPPPGLLISVEIRIPLPLEAHDVLFAFAPAWEPIVIKNGFGA